MPFASANKYDLRMDKKDQLICTWADGSGKNKTSFLVKSFTSTSNPEDFKGADDK